MTESPDSIPPFRQSAAVRLLVLLTLFSFFLLLAAAAGGALSMIGGMGERTRLLLTSTLQCVIGFCLPAYLTARFASASPLRFSGVGTGASPRAFVGVVIVCVLALPAMNQLISWNASLHFPSWASEVERTLRSWEEANSAVAETILSADSFIQMLAGVAVVGILTGFSEEYFFRGTLQTVFVDSGIRKFWAVWCAAAVFSAMHFQFFGFFPRLLMGGFFGWLLVWTGSLWPAVFAHALNNSLVVVASWAFAGSEGFDSLGVAGEGRFPWAAVMSLVATSLFFLQFRNYFFKSNS